MAAKNLAGKTMLSQSNAVTLIPYHLWNNRGPGEMAVWLPIDTAYAEPEPAPTIARTSKMTASIDSKAIIALNDQRMPEHSNDHSIPYLHWWPKKGTTEWVQFDLKKPTLISKVKVYWYDDGPDGGCRVPASWKVQYRMGEEWIDAVTTDEYLVTKDDWDSVSFTPLTTDALRLEVQLPDEYAAGIYEVVIE